jgi:predicted RNase H-like nuclease
VDSRRERQLDREIEQYREAAIVALEQLEWIVSYLQKIRKSQLATALDRNRKRIIERIAADGN